MHEAGRLTDRLIAESLFGWSVEYLPDVGDWCWSVNTRDHWHWLAARSEEDAWNYAPHFSTEMGDAWTIVEHFQAQGWDWAVAMFAHVRDWEACMYHRDYVSVLARADTAALAICRAALAAHAAHAADAAQWARAPE